MAKISANELRWLAETADGKRDVPMLLVKRADGSVDVIEEAKRLATDEVLLELETGSRGGGVDGAAFVRVSWNGRIYDPASGLTDRADALFVTQSSVEKFLLPYYMRFMSGAKVQAIENMLFNDPTVKAAIHIPPSHAFAFPRIGRVSLQEGTDVPTVKFNEEE